MKKLILLLIVSSALLVVSQAAAFPFACEMAISENWGQPAQGYVFWCFQRTDWEPPEGWVMNTPAPTAPVAPMEEPLDLYSTDLVDLAYHDFGTATMSDLTTKMAFSYMATDAAANSSPGYHHLGG